MIRETKTYYAVKDDGIYKVELEFERESFNDPEPSLISRGENLIMTSDAFKEAFDKYIKDERMNKTNELRGFSFRRKRKNDSRAWNNN